MLTSGRPERGDPSAVDGGRQRTQKGKGHGTCPAPKDLGTFPIDFLLAHFGLADGERLLDVDHMSEMRRSCSSAASVSACRSARSTSQAPDAVPRPWLPCFGFAPNRRSRTDMAGSFPEGGCDFYGCIAFRITGQTCFAIETVDIRHAFLRRRSIPLRTPRPTSAGLSSPAFPLLRSRGLAVPRDVRRSSSASRPNRSRGTRCGPLPRIVRIG